jgi:hypothetical protein
MAPWTCDIDDCQQRFSDPTELVIHQSRGHPVHVCGICGKHTPDGYYALQHAIEDHSRTEYMRAYDASAAALRERMETLERLRQLVDFQVVRSALDSVE